MLTGQDTGDKDARFVHWHFVRWHFVLDSYKLSKEKRRGTMRCGSNKIIIGMSPF